MAEYTMVAIADWQVGERNVFNTGVSTVGKGGHDYFCGHCGRKMIHNMDLTRIEAEIVYKCDPCGGHNLPPKVD